MHIPVLLNEVLEYLNPKPGENFIDCTFGFGGHSLAILEKNKPEGTVIGIEQDKEILEKFTNKNKRLDLVEGNFKNLKEIVKKNEFFKFNKISGVLFDLGVSSWHFDKSGRGFSFQTNEPLMMNCSEGGLNAEEIVNQWSKEELIRIFREYGEERFASRIAELIYLNRQKEKLKQQNNW